MPVFNLIASPWRFATLWLNRLSPWTCAAAGAGIMLIVAAVEVAMGHPLICKCGYVSLWAPVHTAETSQQISDWYSLSHIIHGFFFFFLFWLVARRFPVATRALFAIAIEATWEIIENTPMVIDRYRDATISLQYYGDSVLNSSCDILFMLLGFVIASRLPVWMTIVLTIAFEGLVAYFIRDNLTLNIIMLLYPIHAIRVWQAGGEDGAILRLAGDAQRPIRVPFVRWWRIYVPRRGDAR